jgi:hypothetical protein
MRELHQKAKFFAAQKIAFYGIKHEKSTKIVDFPLFFAPKQDSLA